MDAIELLTALQTRVLDSVVPRVRFLLAQEHRLTREHSSLFRATHHRPQRIKDFQQRSWELQNQRKRELQLVVEDRQQQLLRDFSGLARKIENLLQFGSLAPHDVAQACKRIAGIQDGLAAAETECEDILEQEKMLEMDEDRQRDAAQRAARRTGQDRQAVAHGARVPDRVRSVAGRPTAHDRRRGRGHEDGPVPTRGAQDRQDAGEGRAEVTDPLRAAKQLQDELGTFIEESVPLMTLLCTPGLRERHWEDMEKITGVSLGWTPEANLQQMLDAGLQHHIEAIEETCVGATKEFSLEKALGKMEEEWDGMCFGTKEWRTTGTSILSGIDDIQQILDDQIVKVPWLALHQAHHRAT